LRGKRKSDIARPELIRLPLAREIIALREELGGFKDPQALTQLLELINIEWQKRKEERIIITVK